MSNIDLVADKNSIEYLQQQIDILKKEIKILSENTEHSHTGFDTSRVRMQDVDTDLFKVTLNKLGYIRGGQTDYETGTGFFLGYSTDDYKFSIGSATDYLKWDGTNLSLSGTIVASALHIPDEDTTANSFHIETDGDTFWGCTQSDFTSDNDNATAYVLKTGVAKFQSVTLSDNVVISGLQEGSVVDGQYLSALSVSTGALNNLAVTADKIANATITATQIADATITGTQIASATITGSNIGATTIEAGNIANATITGTQIAATTIEAGNIANSTITTTQISNTAGIVGGQIDNLTISAGNISNLTITAAKIADSTITGEKIASDTITGSLLKIGNQSWSHDLVFSSIDADTVAWASGTITMADGSTTYSITGANTGNMAARTYIYLDISGEIGISDSYSEDNVNSGLSSNGVSYDAIGQSFENVDESILESCKFYLKSTFNNTLPTGDVVARVYAHSGTFGTSSVPTGDPLATSDIIDGSNFTTNEYSLTTFNFSGANRITLSSGTKYCIAVSYTSGDGTHSLGVGLDNDSPTHSGNGFRFNTGGSWQSLSAYDFCFYVYSSIPTTDLQTTTTASTAVGDGKILIAVAENSTTEATFQVFGGIGGIAISGGDIENSSILAAQIAANTITANEIAANTITASEIAASTITTSEIAANTIVAGNIAAATITGTEIAAATIAAANIAANTITASELTTGEFVTATANIANAIITDAKISDLAVSKLTAGTITSKAITLAVSAGTGDAKIQAGKTDFGQWATNGFILGIDDSDDDTVKLEITGGNITSGTIQTATADKRIVIDGTNNDIRFYDGINTGFSASIGTYDDAYFRVYLESNDYYGAYFYNVNTFALTSKPIMYIDVNNAGSSVQALLLSNAGTNACLRAYATGTGSHIDLEPLGSDPTSGTIDAGEIAFVGTTLKIHDGTAWREVIDESNADFTELVAGKVTLKSATQALGGGDDFFVINTNVNDMDKASNVVIADDDTYNDGVFGANNFGWLQTELMEVDLTKNFSFQTVVKFDNLTAGTNYSPAFIGIRASASVSTGQKGTDIPNEAGAMKVDHAGFICTLKIADGVRKLWASVSNGTTQSVSEITGTTLNVFNSYRIERSGSNIYFYVNGTLGATLSSNLPDSTSNSIGWLNVEEGSSIITIRNKNAWAYAESLT